MAKKDLYKYDDMIFKREDGNTYSGNNQTNNRRARSQYLADQQASRDAAAKSLAAQNEVNAYDALQQAAYGAWAAEADRPNQAESAYTGGTTPAAQTDADFWAAHPYGNIQYTFDFSDVPAGTNPTGFSYGKAPSYIDPYQQQIAQLQNTILNRGPFSYDAESDPLYQQYAKQYDDAGRRAMQNTLAQVSARTGGLASSYAGSAAQQAYNNYMARLADKVPELQQLAHQMYQDEQTRDMNNLNMLRALSGDDYGRYQDTLAQFNTDRDYDTGLWRYGVEDARYNAEDALNRAAIGASLGDYSGYNALGYDTSAKTAPRYSGGGGTRTAASEEEDEFKPLTASQLNTAEKNGTFTPTFFRSYEAVHGVPYADTVTTYDQASKMLTGMGVTEKPVTETAWKAHKRGRGFNDDGPDAYITDYDTYADYLRDYLKTAQEVVYGF